MDNGNVGIKFILTINDTTTSKNDKSGETKYLANTCIHVTDKSFIKHGIYPPIAVNILPYILFIAKDQRSYINIRNIIH